MRKKIATVVVLSTLAIAAVFWLKYDDFVAIPRARAIITTKLNVTGNIQFRNERIMGSGWFCGELNSESAPGDNSGFRRFIYGGVNETTYIDGHGKLGRQDTADITEIMDKEIEIMKSFNAIRTTAQGIATIQPDARRQKAISLVFLDKWKKYCTE